MLTGLPRVLLLLCLALLIDSAPALADQRIFAISNGVVNQQFQTTLIEASVSNGQVVSVVTRAVVPGRALEDFKISGGNFTKSLAVTAGGRFLVWRQDAPMGGERLVAVDRQTAQVSFFNALPNGLGISDPSQPRLFTWSDNQIVSLSAAGLVALPNTAGLLPRAVSRDGQRLYAIRTATPNLGLYVDALVVLDATSGQILRTVPLPMAYTYVPEVAIAADESTVWLSTVLQGQQSTDLGLLALDANSGAERLAIPLPPTPPLVYAVAQGLVLDDQGQRVAISRTVIGGQGRDTISGAILTFDAQTGLALQSTPSNGFAYLHFDRGERTLLAVSEYEFTFEGSFRHCSPPAVQAFLPPAGSVAVRTDGTTVGCLSVAVASAPDAPVLNSPTVSVDRSVLLSWSGPAELTTGYVVEARSQPGAAELASFAVPSGTSFGVANVPPGSYFVRVRARNDIGLGAPSNEIRVDVP